MGIYFIFLLMLVFGIIISIKLDSISTNLEYRNTLLNEQNEILKEKI